MSGQDEGYLTLLTDLLSPKRLPQGTLASIAFHVGILEDAGLANLVSALRQSPGLFQDIAPVASTSTSRNSSHLLQDIDSATDVALERAQSVFEAVRQGVLARADNVKIADGTGWAARRKYRKSLELMLASLQQSHVTEEQDTATAVKQAIISCGILRALQDLSTKNDKLVTSTGNIVSSITASTVLVLSQAVSCLRDDFSLDRLPVGSHASIAYAISSVVPDIASDRLRPLATEKFFTFGFGYIRSCFVDGLMFADLHRDVEETHEGLSWKTGSTSYTRLQRMKAARTHAILGRFSRSVGKVIESVSSETILHLLLPHLEALEGLAGAVNRDWAACPWSDVSGPEELDPDTRDRDEPWTALKTLLFTLTMIFSAVMSLLNTLPLSPHRAPSNAVLEMAACALRTFSAIYFVTSKFGMNGFGAYQNVWFGSIDLVNRAEPAKVEQILKTFEPRYKADERRDDVLKGAVARSRVTYWFNVLEQVVVQVPDEYLSDTAVPILRPYLTDKQDNEAFEAAHSVMLAVFAKRKSLATDISSWYTTLLIDGFPSKLSISQFRLAFATMISCLNDMEQEVLRQRLDDLEKAIASTPCGASDGSSQVDAPLADASHMNTNVSLDAAFDNASTQMTALQLAEAPSSLIESLALKSRRGHLLLVLIDQLSSVDLDIMQDLLPRVRSFLMEEDSSAPLTSHLALLQVLYNTLSGSMDMIKRETAAKWWLENRHDLVRPDDGSRPVQARL